jgi:hypothetical protein
LSLRLFACALLAAANALADPLVVSLDGDGNPVVRYPIAKDQTELRFANPEERVFTEVRKPFWKFDESCFSLGERGITRTRPECGDLVVKLTWDEVPRDRMYPAVVKMRNGGVMVFAGYIETLVPDRSKLEEIRAIAPAGGVAVFRGDKTSDALLLPASTFDKESSGWLYFGPDRFIDDPAGLLIVDDGIAPVVRAQLTDMVAKVMELYRDRLGALPNGRPSIYVTWSDRDRTMRSWQADVVPGPVMRFGLAGSMWADPTEATKRFFVETIAHEIAHFWNANYFRSAQDAAPWVSEGGAELIAVSALSSLGAMDAAAAQERIDRAIGECAGVAASNAWVGMVTRNYGRSPYACGLAMQLAIVAHSRRLDSKMDPLEFWKQFGTESSPYREASMAVFLARHGDPEGSVLLARMLTDGTMPFMDSLAALYRSGGVGVVKGAGLSDGLKRSAGPGTFAAIMGEACQGSYGFFHRGDYLEVDDRVACPVFKGGMKVKGIEGHDLFTDGIAAATDARKRCGSKGESLHVSRADGDDVVVACSDTLARNIPNPDMLFGLAPGEVPRLLAPAR